MQPAWDVGLFDTALDPGVIETAMILYDSADIIEANSVSHRIKLRRVIAQGSFYGIHGTDSGPLFSAFFPLLAIAIIDRDDSDFELDTTAEGSLLRDNRILWMHMKGWTAYESASSAQPSQFMPLPSFEADWKGQAWITKGQQLALIHQNTADVSARFQLAGIGVQLFSRVLYEVP